MSELLERVYGVLLRLYPTAHREAVGDDMRECFGDLLQSAARERGALGLWWVAGRTFAELPFSALRAHWDSRGTTGGGGPMETLWQDVRYAVRGLVKSPGFTLLAVLSLGLGVGANTGMFSMIYNTLWSGLPVPEADRLVRVHEVRDESTRVSYPNYLDIVEGADVFEGALMHRLESWGMVAGEISQLVHGEVVTANYFDVLRIEPALGRVIDPALHGTPASEPVAVLSHHLWANTFGSDPGVVGRVIELNEQPVTIIGVAPEEFHGTKFGLSLDLWVPLLPWAEAAAWPEGWELRRGSRSLLMLARLADGISHEGANAALETLSGRLATEYPDFNANMTLRATRDAAGQIAPDQAGIPDMIGLLAILGSGLVLLVACGNVASLLMARAVSRRQEIGVRVAMGAGRSRILRQLLTEAVLLALLGALAGIGFAWWVARFDARLLPAIPYRFAISSSLEPVSVLFAAGASLAAVLVFGLAPALQASKPGIAGVLRGDDEAGGLRLSGGRLLNGVVVGVVSLSFVTLFLAGLFISSLQHVRTLDPGFADEGRIIATMDLALGGYSMEEVPAFFDEIEREVAAIPGVTGVALARSVPLGDFSSSSRVYADDREYGPEELGPSAWTTSVRPEWFDVAEIRLLAGRGFTAADEAEAPAVAIVNEALARAFWPGESPLGKRLRFQRDPGDPTVEIVGMVETGRYMNMVETPTPAVYYPFAQAMRTRAILMASTDGDPALLAGPLREAAQRVDPAVPLYDLKTSTEYMANAHWVFRLGADLALAIGVLGALLAAGGLYGIMAFRVGQRRRELGIRIALGADRARVLRHVLSGTARLVAVGLGIGAAIALGASGVLESIVFGVEPTSARTLATSAFALTALALVATLGPALGATRADPVEAIKTE